MATPRFSLLDVYTDLACAGGTALGAVLDPISLSEHRLVKGEETLTLELPRGSAAWAFLLERRVLRTTFSDGSFDEWRITGLTEERTQGALRSTVKAIWPSADLGTAGLVRRVEADGSLRYDFDALALTLAQHLSLFLLPSLSAAGFTWFASGTIDPTAPFDVRYSWTTPLTACQQLAEQAGVEFRIRRNGTTNYLLDFVTQIGAGAPRFYVQLGKNLLGASRQRSADSQATVVVPRGADQGDGIRATLKDALWKVTSTPSTTRAVLADPNGGDGPLAFDDQLNGLWVRKWPAGSWVQVSDSSASLQEITTGAVHGLATNDLVQFGTSSTGGDLTELSAPIPLATYGRIHKVLDRPDLPGTVNLVGNPAMRLYTTGSNAPPDGWAVIPGCGLSVNNVDKETTAGRYRYAGQSAKMVTAGDGQGIETGYASITPTDAQPYGAGYVGFWNDTDGAKVRVDLIAGKATVGISSMSRATSGGITTVTVNTSAAHGLAQGDLAEVLGATGGTTADGYNGIHPASRIVDSDTYEYQLTSDPGTISLSSATNRLVYRFATSGEAASKRWVDFGVQGLNGAPGLKALGVTVIKARIMQDGSTGLTMYVDSAQITQTAQQLAFIEGSGAVALWQAGNRFLLLYGTPAVSVAVDLVDLARLDSATWAADDIALGGPVDLDDPEWGADISTRILGITRNLLVEGDTKVELSSRPEDMTEQLVKPFRRKPLPPPAPIKRRVTRTVRVAAGKFVPVSTADLANLTYNNPALTTTGSSRTGVAQAAITEDMLARGGTIVGFRFAGASATNGTVDVELYRNTVPIAEILIPGGNEADMTLHQLIGAETYWLRAVLAAGAAATLTLEAVELVIETDELVAAPGPGPN